MIVLRVIMGIIVLIALIVELSDWRNGRKDGKQEIFVIMVLVLMEIIIIQG